MRVVFLFCLNSFLLVISVFSQDDNCAFVASAKIQKLLDNSFEMKKYETNERTAFLEKALEEEPKCLPCLMRLGDIEFKVAKRGGSFTQAEQHFEQLIALCPEYHSEPYYLLGAMFYADRQYAKAKEYFDKFLRFPDIDPTKFEKDYAKKYEEVKEALISVDAYAAIYADKIDYAPVKVNGVSSKDDDYLPLISPDGELMFYTRTSYRQAKGDAAPRMMEDFSWSHRPDINTQFDQGKPLPSPFNQGNNCGGATISVDNRELIVAMKNPVDKNPNNIDLFSTRYEKGVNEFGETAYTWSKLENLGPAINTNDGFEGQPSLSGDGKILFFVGVRPECQKDESGNFSHDLFYSSKKEDGTWTDCKPLPPTINTRGQEKGPFMHSDSRTLYFSSNGLLGVGGMDLFYCRMQDDGTFSKPENIGFPINSEADELGIVVTSDGDLAYFGAKNFQSNKGWDIYEFKLPQKAKPEKVMVLKGQVNNTDGSPAQNAQVEITYAESKQTQRVEVHNDDGTYAAIVKIQRNENVTLSIEGEELAFNSRFVARKDATPPVVTKLNMETSKIETGKAVVLNDIYYSTNKSEIAPDSKIILESLAAYLIENPSLEIEIGGHTDNVGDDKTNLALSAERAFEVMSFLNGKGVNSQRMTYKGYGETRAVADNNSEEGRSKNRRTEFLIRKM